MFAQTTESGASYISDNHEDKSSGNLLSVNASQYGAKYRERQILMQNRKGVRIEYTLDRSSLELWISPQMGKSMSYVDANWSNRDDHTKVFDRILLPGCDLSKFIRCDWDPFHSVIYFENQVLHIAQVYDQPAVLVWFEKEGGLVDFKIYGQEVERTEKTFIIDFTNRERRFQSAAILSEGEGYFQQQTQLDKYRSIYTRAHMAPNQVLVISSELQEEQIGEQAKAWSKKVINELLEENEKMIGEHLSEGQFTLKGKPEMQKLLDINRRMGLSMTNWDGFVRSTNQFIYYLQWFRDGGMNSPHMAYSGWLSPAYSQARFALNNPNFTNENQDDIFFGQMMGGPLTKWQEDGLFYTIWPAFTYWTQSGDNSLTSGKYLETMDKAMDWLERRSYDKNEGLFGRYFACETPMTGSRDNGWDNVTGAPTFKWDSQYEGVTIKRSYDNYINMLNYSNYIMLSAIHEDPKKSEEYLNKATALEKGIAKFFEYDDVLPSYGFLESEAGDMLTATPYGMDIWDYVWGLALPTFEITEPAKYRDLRERLLKDMTTTDKGYFLCVYFALLTSMDTEIHNEDKIMAAMDQLVAYSSKPGKYLPMPYSMPEMFNISEENPYHDVRPLLYSAAPWFSAVVNLGMHRLPFGLSVRATKYLDDLKGYAYQGGTLDVKYEGEGEIKEVLVNGTKLKNTYQLPKGLIAKGKNEIVIKMGNNKKSADILIASTVELNTANTKGTTSTFDITAYGKNTLAFKNLNSKVKITDVKGQEVSFETIKMDNLTYLEFKGKGDFKVTF